MTKHNGAGLLSSVGRFLRREPLLHFFALAALLFVANAVFSGDEREVITVDAATRDYLIEQRQSLLLRDMTDREKAEVVENFIEEEILVREAQKRGFTNNSRIRSLLIQNMRFFLANELPKPSEDDLKAYFEANRERFGSGPAVTYAHVFFSDPQAVPGDTLATLRSGADHTGLGEATAQNSRLSRFGERQVVATFGRDQAPAILAIDDEQWHGPFQSPSGVHFLRAVERHVSTRPDFEAARRWLTQDWQLTKTREIVAREIDAFRNNYRIRIEDKKPE